MKILNKYFIKCKECDQLILLQTSEYHDFYDGDDSYYSDYFAVSSLEEVDELNKKYNGLMLDNRYCYSVRPIITLRGDVEIASGTGTKNSPYLLR